MTNAFTVPKRSKIIPNIRPFKPITEEDLESSRTREHITIWSYEMDKQFREEQRKKMKAKI